MNSRHPTLVAPLATAVMATCSGEPTGPAHMPSNEDAAELIVQARDEGARSVLSRNLSVLAPLAFEESFGVPELGPCLGGLGLPDGVAGFGTAAVVNS